jgi:hypothetical protein
MCLVQRSDAISYLFGIQRTLFKKNEFKVFDNTLVVDYFEFQFSINCCKLCMNFQIQLDFSPKKS